MSFPILSIPAASDNPSNSQPDLQQNFTNISGFLSVDHTAPGSSGAGQHNQVTYTNLTAPAAPSNPVSILYTKAGTSLHTEPNLAFINSKGNFFLNSVRAYFLLDTTAPAIPNAFNVVSLTKLGTVFTITLQPNCISTSSNGGNTGLVVSGNNQVFSYSIASNVITLTTASTSNITVLVLQI